MNRFRGTLFHGNVPGGSGLPIYHNEINLECSLLFDNINGEFIYNMSVYAIIYLHIMNGVLQYAYRF